MCSNQRHDALEQLVAGRVTIAVVQDLQPDDVDICGDQRGVDAATAVKLVSRSARPAARVRAPVNGSVSLAARALANASRSTSALRRSRAPASRSTAAASRSAAASSRC